MVTDELDSGYATRILLDFSDEESKNMYSEQVLDAAVIGFDLEGKNQNGIIGKVIIALLSTENQSRQRRQAKNHQSRDVQPDWCRWFSLVLMWRPSVESLSTFPTMQHTLVMMMGT